MKNISIIVAMDRKNLIGKDGKMPWHIPEELEYFKKITMGYKIIMGRKTFESIGKVLPGRENIILTRNSDFHHDNVKVFNELNDLLEYLDNQEEVFIIGGAEIYKLFLPYATKLYITRIECEYEGDTYFPKIDYKGWIEIEKSEIQFSGDLQYQHFVYKLEKKR